MQVLNLHQVLSGADSKRGQARKFIRINAERFAEAYKKATAWVEDFEPEYDDLTVQKSPDGRIAWAFAGGEKSEAYKAFDKHLREETFDVEPYAMTEAILEDIDGIDRLGELILRQLTTEYAVEQAAAAESETQDAE